MIYEVKIREVEPCGCGDEGDLIAELNGKLFKVYYQMPHDFIKEYLLNKLVWEQEDSFVYKIKDSDNCNILINLWLVYGHCKLTENKNKLFQIDLNKCGGLCRGEIISITQDSQVRIDCGIFIDVDNEEDLNSEYKIGAYVEVRGTYQIYFPNTEYDR
ncbi:hypothetical protein B0H39_001852 [Clostridium beijerinckii]|uniref:hypothetical protein n=1 Tax=Clostridium beijerinckii TaxID=1520 RepID=UPI001494810A|nr:hypothetical protein [Clostridium beijerinckii]NOW83971.1 hypothetical protein [Clostridium beijerinckii]